MTRSETKRAIERLQRLQRDIQPKGRQTDTRLTKGIKKQIAELQATL